MTNNKNLEIVKLTGRLQFKHPLGYIKPNGYCFKTEEGYLSFDGIKPYMPKGGFSALQDILEAGGFTDFNNIKLINAMN